MKKFSYQWDDEIFLLHIQLNNDSGKSTEAKIIRKYTGSDSKNEQENIDIDKATSSHRFIVSRTHPKETSFEIEYSDDLVLHVFKIDDRAYYPTEAFYIA